jgi:hypothetical protein
LTSIGWPAGDRALSLGQTSIDAFTATNKPLLQHFQDIVEAENGLLYMRGDGVVVFQNRHYRLTTSASTTSQGTFGDGGGSELPYQSVSPSYDDAQIWNDVRVTAATGTEQAASDSTSQSAYFTRTLVKSGLLIGDASGVGGNTPDNEAAGLAGWLLATYKDPVLRFDRIDLDGAVSDSLWPHMLGRDISDRITVKRRPPPSGSTTISQECWIEAVEHRITDITASFLRWQTAWQLSPANAAGWWILDTGALDSTTRLAH